MKRVLLQFLTLAVLARAEPVAPPTRDDFGHGRLKTAGADASGPRPLIVIVAEFTSTNVVRLAHPSSWYEDYIFSFLPTNSLLRSVNAAFHEMSNSRFFWSPCKAVDLSLTAQDHFPSFPGSAFPNSDLGAHLYHSNIVAKALARRLIDLARFDTDRDKIVTQAELQIMVVKNEDISNGATRATGVVRDPNSGYVWSGESGFSMPLFEHRTDFATVVHEAMHALNLVDLYGKPGECRNSRTTLMSCTGCGAGCAEATDIFHIDPFHKIQLGWSDPRIFPIRRGGLATIPAAQLRDPSAPVILYDQAHDQQLGGGREFFILEYRTRNTPVGPGYDREVAGNGMVLWHVQLDGNKVPSLINERYAVWSEGAPKLEPGSGAVWSGGAITPPLTWIDGSPTGVRLLVHPFPDGADRITVEWLAEGEIWVDFGFAGLETGEVTHPFNTIAEGVDAVPWGGSLKVKSGVTSEILPIGRRLTLEAPLGPVSIGR